MATNKAGLDDLDVQIGARLRRARKVRGVSQQTLGDALGVTFQQVQKYERGTNRVSGASLVRISERLEISPLELLGWGGRSEDGLDWTLAGAPGASELLDAYSKIRSPGLRRAMLELARELAAEPAAEDR